MNESMSVWTGKPEWHATIFRGWKSWVDWSSSKQGVIYCPADPFYIAIYLNHVLFISGAKGSILTSFYGIRWGHHVVGFNSPIDNPFVQLAFEGCQRLCETETTKKEPITSDMIKTLVTKYGGEILLSRFEIFINMLVRVRRIFTHQ